MGKNTDVETVNSVASLIKDNKSLINDKIAIDSTSNEEELKEPKNNKKIIIKKQGNYNKE